MKTCKFISAEYGLPSKIVSGKGTNFFQRYVENFCKWLIIQYTVLSSYNQLSSGQVEACTKFISRKPVGFLHSWYKVLMWRVYIYMQLHMGIHVCMYVGLKYTYYTYICIYICMYECMHTCMYICVCINVISMYTFMYIHRQMYISLYLNRHIYIHIGIYVWRQTCMGIDLCMYAHEYTY